MAAKRGQVLVFGAGALGLGFLAPELSGEYDVVFMAEDFEVVAELALRFGQPALGCFQLYRHGPPGNPDD